MKRLLALTCALFAFSAPAFADANTTAANGSSVSPVPIDYWAIRNAVGAVEISPDGKHILVMKTESKDGDHVLEVYDTSDLSTPKRRLNANPMEIISARWVTNDKIFGTAWQVVRKRVGGPEEDVRSYKAFSYSLEKNKFSEAKGASRIVSLLPKEPNEVLIASGRGNSGALGVDPFAAFRPSSYYRFNLETGVKKLVVKGTQKYANVSFDIDGNPRYTFGRDGEDIVEYYRKPNEDSWTEFNRYDQSDHNNLYQMLSGFQGFAGINANDPSKGYMIAARNGSDKAALWDFDFNTGQYGRKLFEAPNADVTGVMRSSNYWAGDNKVVAAIYPGKKRERHWFDQTEKALIDKVSAGIKNAHSVSITSRTADGQSMIVYNSGPKDPGSYYYLTSGKLMKLGSRNPLIKASHLSNVEFVRYTARDGKSIPAYITKPSGAGPFPTVVLPHGGPHVNEVIGYDEWGQLLANNGYLVIQPQYRMSTGWGKEHFDSAYGQHGLAMQDDKDDSVKYLVERGLTDPDRVAMFGWSYGGYAALVAASREQNLYQCVVAGAAVADAEKVYMLRRNPWSPKALDDWSARRGGKIGINPIKEAAKVNVPVLMVHGDVDARVLYFNMKDYKKEMAKHNKDIQYLTLKGAAHTSNTLMYKHQKEFYTKLLDYLKADCGPGGL